ncbi:MAG: PAS domain S-box protein [Thiotrichales bacterium]|nr:MAG: PAS domain S-box protein [Thiotrichales bacterium]
MNEHHRFGLRGKSTLVLGTLLFFSLIVTNLTSYWQSRNLAEQKIIELEQARLSLLKHEIEGTLEHHHKNLLTLLDVPPVEAIIRARANNGVDPVSGDTLQQWRERLIVIFLAMLKTHPDYQQIRYIDAAGQEQIRVQTAPDGSKLTVSDEDLQDKSASQYVRETLKLKPGEVYYSNVSLNREHGVIQIPYLPVLRLATPVYTKGNQVAGLVVMNLSTEKLFDAVRSETSGLRRSIVDERGYYIKHDDPSKTFNLERGLDYRFQDIEPELAAYASDNDQYFRRHAQHNNEMDGFQKIRFAPNDPSRYWLLTLNIPGHVVFADINYVLNRSLQFSLVFGLLSLLIIVWYISRRILTPIVDLASATDQLQGGDLAVRVDETSAQDEFHTLYSAINAFAENQQQATTQLENRVIAQTKRLSAVIDNIVDGIITIDEGGTIESFNLAAKQIFGYSDAEVIGQNVNMLMPEPYRSEHDNYLKNYIETGEKKIIGIGREVMSRRKDGTTFPTELAVNELVIDDVRYFVGVTRDITERKLTEQALLETRELERANKAKSEFLSRMSHELRTPLHAIIAFSDLILYEKNLEPKLKTHIEHINKAGDHLLTLVDDVLDLARIESGKLSISVEPIKLKAVFEECYSLIKPITRDANVSLSFATDVDYIVKANHTNLKQALLNLLSNAVKYNKQKGTVSVSCDVSKNRRLRINVTDTGNGLSSEQQKQLFKPFERMGAEFTKIKGTGIGLTITKQLVKMMGGVVGVESAEGKGSNFWIELPLSDEQTSDKPQSPPVNRSISKSDECKTIVYVEDDPVNAHLMAEIINKMSNHHLVIAGTGGEGLELILKLLPDVVLLDLGLPDMDGYELLEKMREHPRATKIPAIAMTAKAMMEDVERGERAGFDDYLVKPARAAEILKSIDLVKR